MGYDIETDIGGLDPGVHLLHSARMTSLVVSCFCSYEHVWTTEGVPAQVCISRVANLGLLLQAFMECMYQHELAGYHSSTAYAPHILYLNV